MTRKRTFRRGPQCWRNWGECPWDPAEVQTQSTAFAELGSQQVRGAELHGSSVRCQRRSVTGSGRTLATFCPPVMAAMRSRPGEEARRSRSQMSSTCWETGGKAGTREAIRSLEGEPHADASSSMTPSPKLMLLPTMCLQTPLHVQASPRPPADTPHLLLTPGAGASSMHPWELLRRAESCAHPRPSELKSAF